MGAWGPEIFADDTAADIRGDYRELLEDGTSDDLARQRVVEACRHLGVDQEHVLWFALAAAQSQVGRLDEVTRARALEVIDTGRGLELWAAAGPGELAQRRAGLGELRAHLTGPQPSRTPIRRPWRHETDLRAGDVVSFTATNGEMALFRVLRVEQHRATTQPILQRLQWSGRSLPADRDVGQLGGRIRAGRPPRPEIIGVNRFRRTDPDWADSGFVLAAHVEPRAGDVKTPAWSSMLWTGLQKKVQRDLAG